AASVGTGGPEALATFYRGRRSASTTAADPRSRAPRLIEQTKARGSTRPAAQHRCRSFQRSSDASNRPGPTYLPTGSVVSGFGRTIGPSGKKKISKSRAWHGRPRRVMRPHRIVTAASLESSEGALVTAKLRK